MAAPEDELQYSYLSIIYLSTSEHINIYNKEIVRLPESDRYDLTRSKWTDFYQEFEDAVSTFKFKSEILIVKSRDGGHATTEVKEIILSYPSITQFMVDSHPEILWDNNSGAYLGRYSTENHGSGLYDTEKQAIIDQQRLRPNIIGLSIRNSLSTDSKRKLRLFNYAYNFNTQDDGTTMLFVIIKMVRPDAHTGCPYIKSNMDNMKMSQFKHYTPKYNLHIAEWMNEISIYGETHS